MLVCNVSLLHRRAGIAAGISEAAAALDAPGTGNVVFATLVDDPASVRDRVDAFLGQIMLEAAGAASTVNAGLAYAAMVNEAVTASDLFSGVVPTVITAAVAEAASAVDVPDGTRVGDPYWTSVKLLMGFEGADASTGSPGMTDESSAAHGTATIHNQAQIDTAQFMFGTSSLLLDGTTDWITFPGHADYNLSNQPFTIEAWVRPTSISGGSTTRAICGRWESSGLLNWLFYQFNAQIWLNVSTTTTDNISVLGGGAMTANVWNAVCVDFDGTKYRMYLNGTMVASSTTLRTIANTGTLALGIGASSNSGGLAFAGWIDELRITKGVARYASDSGYTVATSTFPRF